MIHLRSGRSQLCLGRALDLIAQRGLAAIGGGDVVIIEGQQAAAKHNRGDEQRQRKAVEAHAASFEGGDFVLLAHDAEREQHGHQHADGRHVVDQLGVRKNRYVKHGDEVAVAHHVAHQLEEVVDENQRDKAEQHQREIEQEARQDVRIDNLRHQRKRQRLGALFGRRGFRLDRAPQARRSASLT